MRLLLLLPVLALVACNHGVAPGLSGPSPSAPAPLPVAPSPAPGLSGPSPSAPGAPRSAPPAPLDAALEPLRPLLGAWEGTDPTLRATGRFTLEPDLGGKLLVRRNRNDSPQGRHDDLMIVFAVPGALRASYFDSEGHVIQYTVTATADRVELLSDEAPGQPRFRLRYDRRGGDQYTVEFAMAPPGAAEFRRITGGAVHRAR
jgi:hypothetical protein